MKLLNQKLLRAQEIYHKAAVKFECTREIVQGACEHPKIGAAPYVSADYISLQPYYVCLHCGAHESGRFMRHLREETAFQNERDCVPITREEAYRIRLGPKLGDE